ncbi:PQQ-binding-like beta-propeller repeat protein [Planctomicrobium sp. SH664]|uniref:PQQ-binding-like beta-propeller repeat protein n=1 Tax=Planctomicrobium sp. SH664 TaxID=3448125 RepID=UPI003F5CBB95
MLKLRLVWPALALVCLAVSAVQAQQGMLPNEAELNRLGLTMSWWGQCVLDPHRDKLQYLTVDEQLVYGQANSGMITAFQGETGRQLWAQMLSKPDQQSFPVSANDDRALVSIGMNVFSLDKITGAVQWELRVPVHPSASPAIDNDRVYIGAVDGSVYVYDLAKIRRLFVEGKLPLWTERAFVWRFKAPKEIVSTPIPLGNVVCFGTETGAVYGMTAKDKKLRYQFETDGQIRTPIGFSNQSLYVPDLNARMYCLDALTGRVQWMYSSGTPIRQQPRVIGKQVFVIPHREGITSLSTTVGQSLWHNPSITQFVAASDSRIYGSDIEGNLVILDRASGAFIGSLNLRRYTLRVSNDRTDRIVLGTPTGTVIGLREIDSDLPVFHLYPERRPILPQFTPEEGAAEGEAGST